ncbi:hypothetical protein D3874_19675 [Oleomonas cavernae]|uniref:Uncharacterized protein n=1 Tax=Oleomonas cavernae TaxID=2320859 RepID=A0A418WG15_9PROT|nr:hypothetical protein [Oleomonas cavernae]RJF88922.1 hypothetical protein D3874_19675 [Oleomonas cavernae]
MMNSARTSKARPPKPPAGPPAAGGPLPGNRPSQKVWRTEDLPDEVMDALHKVAQTPYDE